MSHRVLAVGNCSYDHGNLAGMLKKHFQATVDAADNTDIAKQLLRERSYHLVIVNRVFDSNSESGIEFIKQLRQNSTEIPFMLISNFDEYQKEAVAVGAVPGFGKSSIGKPEVVELVKKYLC